MSATIEKSFADTYVSHDDETAYCTEMCDLWLAKRLFGVLPESMDVRTFILIETSKLVESGKMRDGVGKKITGKLINTNLLNSFSEYAENIFKVKE